MNLLRLVATSAIILMLGMEIAIADCESGHWVKSKSNDGSIVILEDGSVWRVSYIDIIDSLLWLLTDNVVACDDKLINTDDGTTVEAMRVK